MHAAGFFHEQNRYDRDDYVIVNYTNIQPGTLTNYQFIFKKKYNSIIETSTAEFIAAYDIYGPEAELFLGTIFDTGTKMTKMFIDQ